MRLHSVHSYQNDVGTNPTIRNEKATEMKTLSFDTLTPKQMGLIALLAANELPLTAAQLIADHGYSENYVSSALSGLADRGYLVRAGRSAPVKGRMGHTLWTVTPEVMEVLPPAPLPKLIDVLETAVSKIDYAARALAVLQKANEPIRTSVIARKIGKANDFASVRNILLGMAKSGTAMRVGVSKDGTDSWMLTSKINSMKAEDKAAVTDSIVNTIKTPKASGKVNVAQTIRNLIMASNRPLRTAAIGELLGYSTVDIAPRLEAIAKSGAIVKTRTTGAYGRKVYWSTPENAPLAARAL